MSPSRYDIKIDFDPHRRTFVSQLWHQNQCLETHELPLAKTDIDVTLSVFQFWPIFASKTVLYHPQFADLDVEISLASASFPQNIQQVVLALNTILKKTQQCIKQYRPLFSEAAAFDATLFYNVDHLNTFAELHRDTAPKISTPVYYENHSSGWNKITRSWEEGDGFSVDTLAQYLSQHRIKTVFSVNMYYQAYFMRTQGVFLLPFLKALGVEWVTIDSDIYDTEEFGQIQKGAFNCPSFRRFSIWPHVVSHFDRAYDNTNVRYFLVGDVKKRPAAAIETLEAGYDAVVIANARLAPVLSDLPSTLFLLEQTDAEEAYLDFQRLYYAILHLLLFSRDVSRSEKEKRFARLSNVYINALSFLKYDAIQGLIDNDFPTQIFGDQAWAKIFPMAYQHKYLNEKEMEDLFGSKRHLYVLMNQNYSYFENNPVVLRALNLGVPYVCFSSLVRTPDLEGLAHVEYRNAAELADKARRVNECIQNPEYQKSLSALLEKTNRCREEFDSLVLGKSNDDSYYRNLCENHDSLMVAQLKTYFQKSADKIFFAYDSLFDGNSLRFSPDKSRFSDRGFFRNLFPGGAKC